VSFGHLALEVPFANTFADVEEGEPVALVDSSGWLTLAIRMGSAAERYGIEPGASARVRAL
jgi:S-adenosylmethionine hydrolase